MMNITQIDLTPAGKRVVYLDGEFYLLRVWERGYWRAIKVKQDSNGFWYCCDDDDWIIKDGVVQWREVGWDLRRENVK